MKSGGLYHPKTIQLAELLRIKHPHAIGILELLFHMTAEYAPEGDIGRFDNKRIEAGLCWHGRTGKLVEALVSAGWLDEDPCYRLVTHDWRDHAPEYVKKRLDRAGKHFVSVTRKVTGQRQPASGAHSDSGSLPNPIQPNLVVVEPSPVEPSPPKGDVSSQVSPPRREENSDDDRHEFDWIAYASPADELVALVKATGQGVLDHRTMDWIQSKLKSNGVSMAEFVEFIKAHHNLRKATNPAALLMDLAKSVLSARAAVVPESQAKRAQTSICELGRCEDGSGLVRRGDLFVACECAIGQRILAARAKSKPDVASSGEVA